MGKSHKARAQLLAQVASIAVLVLTITPAGARWTDARALPKSAQPKWTAAAVEQTSPAAPAAPNLTRGKRAFERHCSMCHELATVTKHGMDRAMWAETLVRMREHGLDIRQREMDDILDYLSHTFS